MLLLKRLVLKLVLNLALRLLNGFKSRRRPWIQSGVTTEISQEHTCRLRAERSHPSLKMIVTMLVLLLLRAFEEPRHPSILLRSTKFDTLQLLSTVMMIVHDDRLAIRTREDHQILLLRKKRSRDEDRPNIQEIHILSSHLLLSYLPRSPRSRHTLQNHLCQRLGKNQVEPELKMIIPEKTLALLLFPEHKPSQATQEIEVGNMVRVG